MRRIQFSLTPAAGKRLIGLGLAVHPTVQRTLKGGRLVITAGTTNSYVAQEILGRIGDAQGFDPKGFFRGALRADGGQGNSVPAIGDVVIEAGKWQRDVDSRAIAAELTSEDLILKGGNAVDLDNREAAVLIGDPQGGTVGWVVPAIIGRRVQLISPIGVEKRISGPLSFLCLEANEPISQGVRLGALPGDIFTELDAIFLLTGAQATIIAGGGIAGAEGSVYLSCEGDDMQLEGLGKLMDTVSGEAPFQP